MADIKNLMFGVLFIIAVLSFGASLFSFAVTSGGWSTAYPSSFSNAQSYLNTTSGITSQLSNQTANVGNTPASTDPTLTYGTILTVGLQILTLPINAANLLISILTDMAANPSIGGFIPGWFVAIVVIGLIMLVILGILGAVLKWWL